MANHKVPRDIMILEELPRSTTGEILRPHLQEMANRGDTDTERG